MHYFLISGEASGDLHGSHLIAALKQHDPTARFSFLGGDKMASEAGTDPIIHYRQMAYMGFSEVLRHLPAVLGNLRRTKKEVIARRPDCVILIDYPSFNLKVARTAAKSGIPVYYYISPKIWAWKTWRVKAIRRTVRRVFSILPFEPEFYRSHGYEATYVGNPSVNEVDNILKGIASYDDFIATHRLRRRPLIALMPGSRIGEIRNNLPVMTAALDTVPQYRGVIIGAPSVDDEVYARFGAGGIPVLREKSAVDILPHCRAALVTSGTATLETALAGTPQVALYRGNGSRLTYSIMKRILSIPFVTLPNLIAGRQVIPELLMNFCTPEAASEALIPLLRDDSPQRQAQIDGYREIRNHLGTSDAAQTTACEIISDLSGQATKPRNAF